MKKLMLCDDAHLSEVAPLGVANRCGLEVQTFYDPDWPMLQPDAIDEHRRVLAGISTRALHGPFADLCPGSMDSMVRAVARDRHKMALDIVGRLRELPHLSVLWIPAGDRPRGGQPGPGGAAGPPEGDHRGSTPPDGFNISALIGSLGRTRPVTGPNRRIVLPPLTRARRAPTGRPRR
jgi:hypothetical protein